MSHIFWEVIAQISHRWVALGFWKSGTSESMGWSSLSLFNWLQKIPHFQTHPLHRIIFKKQVVPTSLGPASSKRLCTWTDKIEKNGKALGFFTKEQPRPPGNIYNLAMVWSLEVSTELVMGRTPIYQGPPNNHRYGHLWKIGRLRCARAIRLAATRH